jgi:hypothetical protein
VKIRAGKYLKKKKRGKKQNTKWIWCDYILPNNS